MPCDTIRESAVDLGRVDLDRLARVLTSERWTVQTRDGYLRAERGGVTLTVRDRQATVAAAAYLGVDATATAAAVKRSYSTALVAEAAQRFGFRVKERSATPNGQRIKLAR